MKYKNTVGFMTGRVITEVGSVDLWFSFFDALDEHFEDSKKVFPIIRKMLFQGKVKAKYAKPALEEMIRIREVFKKLDAPNGGKLSDYFITTTKRNLINELVDSFTFCINENYDTKVVSYDSPVETAFL